MVIENLIFNCSTLNSNM